MEPILPVAREQELSKRIDNADRVIKFAGVGAAIVMFVMLVVVIFQLINLNGQIQATLQQVRDSQLANQKTGTENHARTQAYIKCIAQVLQKPLAERTQLDIDSCTTNADKTTESVSEPQANTQSTSAITPEAASTVVSSTTTNNTTTNNNTTTEEQGFKLSDLPLVGGLLKPLGL